eukprot:CAMPEP_0196718112 /NCGR_PEP_ID=MMETSP1091-20130531/1395_1 /TAXON_ID=302021 /ORGANISM="Rhodomonas sp., Strain CCMP768" /LENGTH=121 /DNA_ID=CAMNT_0042058691 /DNA_START=238 /DNA_END=600 /DNA_ORIENTATION=+
MADGGEAKDPAAAAEEAASAPINPVGGGKKDDKVRIFVKNVGNAPILKTTEFSASASSPFSRVIQHIQNKIRTSEMHKDAVIHLFVNQSFSPSPDEQLGDLYKCFQMDGKLQIDYALMEAW